MKGPKLLSRAERFDLYQSLVRDPLSFSEKDVSILVQNARLDPRLAEVVTEHLRDYWWKYDSRSLNRRLRRQPWPESIKPMIAQILSLCEASSGIRVRFGRWASEVLSGIGDSPNPQLYFISPPRPRGKTQDLQVAESHPSFTKFGFFAKDILFNKGQPGAIQEKPSRPGTVLGTEDLLKLDLLARIRPRFAGAKLKDLEKTYGIDRTTLSSLRSGKVSRMSVSRLAQIVDRLKEAKVTSRSAGP